MARRYRLTTGLGLAALAVLLMGCERVEKPTSDRTAPTLQWTVLDRLTNESTVINAQGTYSAVRGRHYLVTLKALDPQGIHEITLGSTAWWQCHGVEATSTTGPGLGSIDVQTLEPDAAGTVLTEIFLLRDAPTKYPCDSPDVFGGGITELSGTGENYFDGLTTGTLTITVEGVRQ